MHLHLASTTNSRLECHNHKLKDVVSGSMSISEMFDNVLLFCRSNATEYGHKSSVEEFSSSCSADDSIPGVTDITSSCTSDVATRIVEQLKLSQKLQYEIREGEDATVLVCNHQHYHVTLSEHRCSCSFSKTMGLPCRHLFAVRASQNLPVFELQLVAQRWHKEYQLLVGAANESRENSASVGMSLSTLPVKSKFSGTLSRNQKYSSALEIGKKLTLVASGCGMPDFRKRYQQLECLLHCWEEGVSVDIVSACDIESFSTPATDKSNAELSNQNVYHLICE